MFSRAFDWLSQKAGQFSCLTRTSPRDGPSPLEPTEYKYRHVFNNVAVPVDTHGAVQVIVSVNVLDILKVDSTEETFTAIFTLHLWYVDPALKDFESKVHYMKDGIARKIEKAKVVACCGYDGKTELVIKYIDNGATKSKKIKPTDVLSVEQPDWSRPCNLFNPEWTIMNAVGKPETMLEQRKLEYCSDRGGHVSHKYKLQATFVERLELHDFPFDRQVLQMKFVAEVPRFKMQFAPFVQTAGTMKGGSPDPKAPHAVPVEWRVDDDKQALSNVYRKGNLSRFDVAIHLQRKPQFYLWNVMIVLFFITIASAGAFHLDPQDVAGRQSLLLTLLMATVGYKLVLATWLPVKPYLTFMDIYILSSFMIQFIVITENIVVVQFFCKAIEDGDKVYDGNYTGIYGNRAPPSHECKSAVSDFEEFFAYAIYGAWIGWHVIFFLWPRFAVGLAQFPSVVWNRMVRFSEQCYACLPGCLKPFLRCCISMWNPFRTWDTVYKENGMPMPESNKFLKPTDKNNPNPYEIYTGMLPPSSGPDESVAPSTNRADETNDVWAPRGIFSRTINPDASDIDVEVPSPSDRPGEHRALSTARREQGTTLLGRHSDQASRRSSSKPERSDRAVARKRSAGRSSDGDYLAAMA